MRRPTPILAFHERHGRGVAGFAQPHRRAISTSRASSRWSTCWLHADLIYVIGSKRAFPVTAYLSLTLSQQGVRNVLVDNVGSTALDQIGCIGKGDAVLAVSFSPTIRSRRTSSPWRASGRRGSSPITDSTFSPLVSCRTHWVEVVEFRFRRLPLARRIAGGRHGAGARRRRAPAIAARRLTVGKARFHIVKNRNSFRERRWRSGSAAALAQARRLAKLRLRAVASSDAGRRCSAACRPPSAAGLRSLSPQGRHGAYRRRRVPPLPPGRIHRRPACQQFDRWGVVGHQYPQSTACRDAGPAIRPLHPPDPARTTASRRASSAASSSRRQPGERGAGARGAGVARYRCGHADGHREGLLPQAVERRARSAISPISSHDLANPEAPAACRACIVRALEMRMQSHGRPLTLMSCDNIPANGVHPRQCRETRWRNGAAAGLPTWIARQRGLSVEHGRPHRAGDVAGRHRHRSSGASAIATRRWSSASRSANG